MTSRRPSAWGRPPALVHGAAFGCFMPQPSCCVWCSVQARVAPGEGGNRKNENRQGRYQAPRDLLPLMGYIPGSIIQRSLHPAVHVARSGTRWAEGHRDSRGSARDDDGAPTEQRRRPRAPNTKPRHPSPSAAQHFPSRRC